jgi:uncharacterized cofD-like protein
LAASLRAIRRYAGDVTAVVSVADDGGSSGRLRDSLAMPAPGDLRRCITALADEDSLLGRCLEYRFPSGDLAGHALGNLLIAGLAEAPTGFLAALDEVCRLVGATGRVLPAAVEPVTLMADTDHPTGVEGQVAVQNSVGIRRVRLRPADPVTPPEVGAAIRAADQVVIGPGSLFTSVLAAAIVPEVLAALEQTAARRVYVCNLRGERPETSDFSAADHVAALRAHGVPVDVALCDAGALRCDGADLGDAVCVERQVAAASGFGHDAALLAEALSGLV